MIAESGYPIFLSLNFTPSKQSKYRSCHTQKYVIDLELDYELGIIRILLGIAFCGWMGGFLGVGTTGCG